MSALTARLRSLGTLVCLLGAMLGLSGCGKTNTPPTAENDGVYVTAGPITYQLQISRQLNPYSTEDRQYVTGLPAAQAVLGPTQMWYGVFMWAKNQTQTAQTSTNNFDIVDTEGTHYYPIAVNPSLNQYAWTAQSLAPGAIQPAPDTTASFGPTQGELLLFKLPNAVYDNRPLTLEIRSPGASRKLWATISLDL